MKGILFDENLPSRIYFAPKLPVLSAAAVLGKSATDEQIWLFARANELVIVSKDADFSDLMILRQPPPWVVHLRFGNMRKREFHTFFAQVWPQIESLLNSHKLVNIYKDSCEIRRSGKEESGLNELRCCKGNSRAAAADRPESRLPSGV
jgi:predicted nuclease of predicted toxin-antitoxin system